MKVRENIGTNQSVAWSSNFQNNWTTFCKIFRSDVFVFRNFTQRNELHFIFSHINLKFLLFNRCSFNLWKLVPQKNSASSRVRKRRHAPFLSIWRAIFCESRFEKSDALYFAQNKPTSLVQLDASGHSFDQQIRDFGRLIDDQLGVEFNDFWKK